MSGPPLGAQSTPAFEPPLPVICSLAAAIQTAATKYESGKTPLEKAAALRELQGLSVKLSRVTNPIPQRFMELNFAPIINLCVRIAIEMGLFKILPQSGEPITIPELSKLLNAEDEFVIRIARVLGAVEILEERESASQPLAYSHTPISRFISNPVAEASSRHLFDNMLSAQVNSGVSYYRKYGFKNPEDSKNSPFSFAHGVEDKSIFDILEMNPESMALFNKAMAITSILGLKEVVMAYPFDQLKANADGVVLVDVGGGKGQVVNEIKKVYPGMGRMALEDMKVVLDGGVVVGSGEVDLQPYDFFKEVQPIKGSNYFFKSIFHDWPDSSCLEILRNLAPAMSGSPHSRLLICELVIPDRKPQVAKVLRDINMLCIAGKERNMSQWHNLLGRAGFKILQFYGLESMNSSIIEAVLDD